MKYALQDLQTDLEQPADPCCLINVFIFANTIREIKKVKLDDFPSVMLVIQAYLSIYSAS